MKHSKESWIQAGIQLLTKNGPADLKIDRLCRTLTVTKGSFYHHFANLSELEFAILDHWEEGQTSAIIEEVEQFQSPEERSAALENITREVDHSLEKALRAWSLYNKDVELRVMHVDQRRMQYLTQLIAPLLRPSLSPDLVAKTIYAHFLGCQQLESSFSVADQESMDQLLRSLTTEEKSV